MAKPIRTLPSLNHAPRVNSPNYRPQPKPLHGPPRARIDQESDTRRSDGQNPISFEPSLLIDHHSQTRVSHERQKGKNSSIQKLRAKRISKTKEETGGDIGLLHKSWKSELLFQILVHEPSMELQNTVKEALNALYHHPDDTVRMQADRWLQDFQRTLDAWQVLHYP